MKKLFHFLFFLLISLLVGCSSPGKLYNKGDYYKAVIESVKKLRSSPTKTDMQEVLKQAYPQAVRMNLHNINNDLESTAPDRYDTMVEQYEQLNQMAKEIYACPKALELIPAPKDYQAELRRAKEMAATQNYDLGVKALRAGTIEQARQAYQYFTKTNEYQPNYRDVASKLEKARYAATLRVVVLPPQTPARFQVSADFFYNNLVSEMNRTNSRKFVRFYTLREAENERLQAHNIIVLDFIDFTVGNVNETRNTKDERRDNIVIGTVDINGEKKDVHGSATAKFTRYTREIVSGGTLNVRILDKTNNDRIINQRPFSGSYVWNTEWASYTGDDRALSETQKRLAKRQPEIQPSHQDLFVEFTKPIYSQVVSYISSIYY